MRASAPILLLAGVSGRQIDVHVDVGDIEHREDFAARRQHFADVGDAVLDAAVLRRDKRIVGDVDLVELDVVGRGVERALGLRRRERWRAPESGGRAVEGLLALVEQFVGRVAVRDERGSCGRISCCASFTCACCCTTLALASSSAALRLLHLRLGSLQRGLNVAHIHAGDDLARLDQVALVDEQFGDASGEFGVDVDLVGLDAAISRHDPVRKLRQMLAPPINPPAPRPAQIRATTRSTCQRDFRRGGAAGFGAAGSVCGAGTRAREEASAAAGASPGVAALCRSGGAMGFVGTHAPIAEIDRPAR